MNNLMLFLIISLVIVSVLSVVFAAAWVYKDAKKRGLPAGLWAFLVVISANFIGLILYILITRKQENPNKPPERTGRGLLAACIACLALVVILSVALTVSVFLPSEGFMHVNSRSGFQHNFLDNTTARGIRQNSSGGTWEISFREASAGYTFTNFYRARTQPLHVKFNLSYTGYVNLVISQDNVTINETLTAGSHNFDMSAFNTGRIRMEIINLYDGTDFSAILDVVRE